MNRQRTVGLVLFALLLLVGIVAVGAFMLSHGNSTSHDMPGMTGSMPGMQIGTTTP